jgi:hypothetical protein
MLLKKEIRELQWEKKIITKGYTEMYQKKLAYKQQGEKRILAAFWVSWWVWNREKTADNWARISEWNAHVARHPRSSSHVGKVGFGEGSSVHRAGSLSQLLWTRESWTVFSRLWNSVQRGFSLLTSCCGSMTFWHGTGSAADPCLWLMDLDPDPAFFLTDLQDGNKKRFF